MTPHEKAVNALNARLERLRVNLLDARTDSARRFLFQSMVVTLGVGDALNDYIKMVGAYAQRRHGELKHANDILGARHADLLQSGKQLLEKLKANPGDKGIRKEIEAAQQAMTGIQKTLRRGTNALQRELGPILAMIDKIAESVRRLSEADDGNALKRELKAVVGSAREFYAAHTKAGAKRLEAATAWESSALTEVDQATERSDAFARAVFQAMVSLDLMTVTLSENPAESAEEGLRRANESAAKRITNIAARFGDAGTGGGQAS